MSALKTQIHALAESFAAGVLAAIGSASLEDILAESGGEPKRGPGRPTETDAAISGSPKPAKRKNGRLARRSASDIEHVVELIVAKLREHRAGLRSEQLQKALRFSKEEIVGPITAALGAKKIVKTGEKRATTYFAR